MPTYSPSIVEFRFYAARLGPSHMVAQLLHCSPDAVRSWACGKRAVPGLVIEHLKLLSSSMGLAPMEAAEAPVTQFRVAKDTRSALQRQLTKAAKARLDAGKGQLVPSEEQRKYLADQSIEAVILAGNPTLKTAH